VSKTGGFWFLIFYLVGMLFFSNAANNSRCEISFWSEWWNTVTWPAIVAQQSAVEFYGVPEKTKIYECEKAND